MNAHMRDRIREAVGRWLDGTKKPVSLFALSAKADEFAKALDKRRKHGIAESLYDYETFVPKGWSERWLKSKGGSDALLMVVPSDWKDGDSMSNSLLLGAGSLVEAKPEELNL